MTQDAEPDGGVRRTYANGDVYRGEWGGKTAEGEAPHGQGVMVFASGGRYEGQWARPPVRVAPVLLRRPRSVSAGGGSGPAWGGRLERVCRCALDIS